MGRRTGVRSVPGQAAFAGPDRQVPPARVGRPQVIGDLQRYGEVRRGEAAGGDGSGRVEQAEHPALPFGDVRVLLAQHPPERIGRADLGARRLGHRGVGCGHRPQRPGGRGRGRHYPLDEDLVVAVLPAVAEEAVRGQIGVAVLVRVPTGTGQPAAHGGLVEGDRAAVAGVRMDAADDLEHPGGVVRARAPDPGRGAGLRPGHHRQRPAGQHRLVPVPGDLPAERPVDRHRRRVEGRQRVAAFGHELGERGHQGAAHALAAALGRDLDARHPGHRDGPAVPPLAHIVVQRGARQPAAVEGAQGPARGHDRLDLRLHHRLVRRAERPHGQVDVLVPVEVLGERADDHVSGQPSFSITSSGTE